MAFPTLVPKAVAVAGVAIKANVEPVLVRRVPLTLLHIAEGPKAAADVVEDGVEHHADAMGMQRVAYGGKVGVPTQATVDMAQAACIVAVAIRFERWVDEHSANAEFLQVVGPLGNLHDRSIGVGFDIGGLGELILGNGGGVFARSSAKAQRIDLIERRLVCPHSNLPVSSTQRHPLYARQVANLGRSCFSYPDPFPSCGGIRTVCRVYWTQQSVFHRN